jgi:hypothetical protein
MRRVGPSAALFVSLLATAIAATTADAALPEFSPPFAKSFVSEGGVSVLETVGKDKIECAAEKDFGEVTSPKEGVDTIILTGCKITIPGAILPCKTETAAPEEIVTKTLPLTLGYITHTALKTIVGVELGKGEAPIAFIECAGAAAPLKVLVIGSFIGKIGPIKKPVKPFPAGHFTLTFGQAKGKQKPKHFEGAPPDLFLTMIGGGPFEETGFSSKDSVGFPETVTIAA